GAGHDVPARAVLDEDAVGRPVDVPLQQLQAPPAGLLGLLAGGDVHARALVADDPPGRVADGAGGLGDPDDATVLAVDLVLEPGDGPLLGHEALELLPPLLPDVALPADVGPLADQLLGRAEAEDARHRPVGWQDPALRRGLEDALDGVVEDGAVLRLRQAQGLLRALPLDGDAGDPRGDVDQPDLGRAGAARLAVVHGERPEHVAP